VRKNRQLKQEVVYWSTVSPCHASLLHTSFCQLGARFNGSSGCINGKYCVNDSLYRASSYGRKGRQVRK